MVSRFPTYLHWPIWLAELATGAKSFRDNPLLGSRRLNRLGLHRSRLRIAAAMTAWRRFCLSGGLPRADREAFARQGYVQWNDMLPEDGFARMQAAILDQAWPARDMVQGPAMTRRIAVDPAMLQAVPELKTLISSRRWRGLLRYVAATRAEPLYYIQTIFTHADGGEEDPQTIIHADTFHPTMKAWLFLGDVAPEDGPFTYVPGSHRLSPARLAWEEARVLQGAEAMDRMSAKGSLRVEQDELAALGLPEPKAFDVPANTLVVADTFGFHARSAAQRPSVRVELWAYTRRNPFLPWTGLSPVNLPFLRYRRTNFYWWFQDSFPKWAGLRMRPIGLKKPTEPVER